MGNHGATAQATSSWGWGIAIGQQHRGFGGQPGCPKPEHPKPEQAAPCACLLQTGATRVSLPPSSVQGGSVLVLPWGWHQLGNLCALEQGARRAGGCLPASGPPAHLAAAGTVASDCAAMSLSPTVLPMSVAGPGCPSQPGSIAACTLPSGSCPFLRVRQPDQPPRSAGGPEFGLFLPLESGGWAVTMCCLWLDLEQWDPLAFPCLARPSPWPQGCHPLRTG